MNVLNVTLIFICTKLLVHKNVLMELFLKILIILAHLVLYVKLVKPYPQLAKLVKLEDFYLELIVNWNVLMGTTEILSLRGVSLAIQLADFALDLTAINAKPVNQVFIFNNQHVTPKDNVQKDLLILELKQIMRLVFNVNSVLPVRLQQTIVLNVKLIISW